MTNNEAITTLKANYPDACYTQLREAVDAAIKALGALEQLSKNSPELYKGNGELSGLYDMLLPESPYVFYDNDRGCCINTADVLTLIAQLSVTGHWISVFDEDEDKCSECQTTFFCASTRFNFCPNCGAKMEGEK